MTEVVVNVKTGNVQVLKIVSPSPIPPDGAFLFGSHPQKLMAYVPMRPLAGHEFIALKPPAES